MSVNDIVIKEIMAVAHCGNSGLCSSLKTSSDLHFSV